LAQADPPATAVTDAVEDFVDGGSLGQPTQFAGQVLLQRLAAALGAALQGGVDVVGNIAH
jgi:hypothetical protein